jgi:IclR family mhp operon transcriptional activator
MPAPSGRGFGSVEGFLDSAALLQSEVHDAQEGANVGAAPAIRAVVRAVDLLRALNQRPVSTLDFLHLQTRLPKPSIVRMMQTLERCGLVQHAPQHGAYYLTSGVLSLSHGYHSEPMVVEAAAPLLDALTLRLKWPLAIAMLEDFSMIVRYSTIPLSPLALRHSTLNVSLSLVSRAIGRAYLAFCPPDQQGALLHALAASASPEDERAKDAGEMQRVLDDVRSKGFAMRDPSVWPASNTLAVPVFGDNGVVCSLGLTYFSSAMKPAQAVERHLPELQEVARKIQARLKDLQSAGAPQKPEHARRSRRPRRAAAQIPPCGACGNAA